MYRIKGVSAVVGNLTERVATLSAAGIFLLLPLLAGCSGPLSSLEPGGPSARASAWLWWGMFGLFGVIMLVVIGLWIYAMGRQPLEPDPQQDARNHTRWIVWGGLVLPISAMSVVLAFGVPMGQRMLPLPVAEGDPLQIEVTAHQWRWEVRYPDQGIRLENEIHIPAGEPVDLQLTSEDVIHAFWVPQLAGKLDMLPGRVNTLRLEADHPGRYRGVCAEFCGVGHSHMAFVVIAHGADDWQDWLSAGGRAEAAVTRAGEGADESVGESAGESTAEPVEQESSDD